MRIAAAIACCATSVAAQSFQAPSGMTAEVAELVIEEETGFARFRFVSPDLGPETVLFDDLLIDATWICETLALPSLAAQGQTAEQIIIALADRDVPFGVIDHDATQFFIGFSTQGETCIEEVF